MRSLISQFEPGRWYLVVTCPSCKTRLPMMYDLSEGKSDIQGSYRWDCPVCERTHVYEPEDIERYHHPETATS